MDFAKRIEQIFFPPFVALVGGIMLLAYLNWNLHDSVTVFSSFLAYWAVTFVFKSQMDNESKIYASGGVLSFPVFVICLVLLNLSKEVIFSGFAAFSLLIAVYTIRLQWNISAHVSATVVVATILTFADPVFSVLYLVLPLVVWSRFKRRAHTLLQVSAGLVLGFLVACVSFWSVGLA